MKCRQFLGEESRADIMEEVMLSWVLTVEYEFVKW